MRNAAIFSLAAALCLAAGDASAAPEDDFNWIDNGTTVTITGFKTGVTVPAALAVPGTLDSKPVTVIGANAFANKPEITSVSLPSGLTTIGSQAFGLCLNLASVTIPDSVTSIGASAFLYCSGLTSVTLPPNLTSLGISALSGCSGLTVVTVPVGITSLENGVFSNCTALQGVTFEGVLTSIGDSAFFGCAGLQNFVVPASVTVIGKKAFQNCTNLASVMLPTNLQAFADYIFAGCSGLQSMTIPASVTSIGTQAFLNCTGLTSLTISDGSPGSLTIGSQAFYNCDGLTGITIPASVTSIGYRAFYQCSFLEEATFMGDAPVLGAEVFDFTAAGFSVYYSEGAAGFTSPTWEGYPASVVGGSDPITAWLSDNGLPANADLLSDGNGDGVSLLMAYALNLDPNANLSGSLPQPVVEGNQLSLTYYAGIAGIVYTVETSDDVATWTTAGVTVSPPDGNQMRTASVDMTDPGRFLRLSVSH